ncbi:hypothetical protein BS47DRAFT_461580 [Hydnum rufescens UP504]|uniref:Uncharacterized protein n=1 Tax=Hydnum rufescens UP504 TaxID=1448309 RepID=A0A9P6AIU4_9AGAM|nr:hypothetical protein BS47DRAFT_461580 [Hydnum rufescens UP504]
MSGSKVPYSDRDKARAPGGLLPSVEIRPGPLPRRDQYAPPDIQYSLAPAQQTAGTEPQIPPVNSTPFAKGVSSHSDESSRGVAELRPLIDEDLKYRKEIPVDQFVEHMLCYSLGGSIDDPALKQLCAAKDTKDLLEEFCSQTGAETTRYQPFANLANHF